MHPLELNFLLIWTIAWKKDYFCVDFQFGREKNDFCGDFSHFRVSLYFIVQLQYLAIF